MSQSQRFLKPVAKRASTPLFLGTENTLLWLRPDSDTVSTGGCRTLTASDKSSFVGSVALTGRGTNDFWFEIGFKPTGVTGTQYLYWDGGDLGAPGFEVYLSDATLYLVVTDGTTILTKTIASFATAGVWHHLLIAFDRSGSATIYKNGTSVGTLDISSLVAADLTPLGATTPCVGSYSDNFAYWYGGSITYIRYGEGYVPTTSDVTWAYNGGNFCTYADLDELGGSLFTSLKRNYECNETDPTANLIDQHDLPGDGSNDLVRTHAELLSDTGFETRAGITGASFVATDEVHLEAADNAALDLDTGDFLLNVNVLRTTATQQVIVSKYQDADNYWYLEFDAAHKMHFKARASGADEIDIQGTTALSSTTTKYHLQVICDRSDASNCKVLYNGTNDTTGTPTVSADTIANSGKLYVGQLGNGTLYFNGRIAMVGIGKPADVSAAAVATALGVVDGADGLGQYYNEQSASDKATLAWSAFYDLTDGPYSATQTANDFVGSNDLTFTAGELVTNGDFATGDLTGWSGTFDGAQANVANALHIASSGDSDPGYCSIDQDGGANRFPIGRTYTFSCNATKASGGNMYWAIMNSVLGATCGLNGSLNDGGATSLTARISYPGRYLEFYCVNNSVTDWTVDNVSIKAASLPLASDADLFGSWTESAASGDSQVAAYTLSPQAGAISCRLMENAAGEAASIAQDILTVGDEYTYSMQSQGSAAGKTYTVSCGTATTVKTADTGSFGAETGTLTCAGNGTFKIESTDAASASIYLDTISVKATKIAVGNGPAEAIASDSIGTNHATLTGFSAAQLISSWVVDGDNYGLRLDGAANYLALASAITSGTTWSFSCKIKLIAAPVDKANLFGTADGSAGLFVNDDRKVNLYYGGDKLSTTALTLDTWAYIGVSVSAGNATFYLNGATDGTTTGVTSISIVRIGGDAASQFLNAEINDVRYYGATALTAEQFLELHSMDEDENSYGTGTGTATVTIPGLVAQWKFEDGPFGQPGEGDPIISWVSKEGDRRLLQQTTAGSRPTYHLAEVNGHPAVYFNGTSMFLSLGSAILSGTEGTIAFAVKFTDPTSCTILSSADTATATKYVALGTNASDQMQVDQDETDVNTTVRGGTTLGTDWHIIFYESNGSAYFLAIDDVDETLTAASGLNNGDWWDDSTGKDNTVLGALVTSGGTSLYFEGYIADIIVYKKCLSVAERTNLYKNYLKPRYL